MILKESGKEHIKNTTRISAFRTSAAAIITATLLLGSASFAQSGNSSDNSSSNSSDSSNRTATTVRTEEPRDNGSNLGWIGLLGLAGLAGLLKKPQREVVHQTEVRTVTPNTNPPHNPNIQNR